MPVELKAELEREAERLALAERRIVHLMRLGAIGPGSAWLLVMELRIARGQVMGWQILRPLSAFRQAQARVRGVS